MGEGCFMMSNISEDGTVIKLLLIDDEEDFREIVRQRLEFYGFVVSTASDGEDGLEQLREGSFDAVLLDLMMPKMDGYEFCEIVKSDNGLRAIPIIIISAVSKHEAFPRLKSLGINLYLEKLSSNDDMMETLNGALAAKANRKDGRRTTAEKELMN
jgi:CheY-like chemotaxis protein